MGDLIAYGLRWPEGTHPLDIERSCVRKGGEWTQGGVKYGRGLLYHYRAIQTLLWPWSDHHRWSDLILSTVLAERITVVQGAKDSSKTHTFSKYALADYFCFPDETLIMISSTNARELENRVWGEVKSLWQSARDSYPAFPGNVVHNKYGIFTDSLDESGDVRDERRGVRCIPCIGGTGEWVGMERFVGVKQKRRRLLGDELQFMDPVYVTAIDALDKGDFKFAGAGNPIGGNGKALDRIAEPKEGWSSLSEERVRKTTTWRNRYGGITIQLPGTDSPNFDMDRPKDYPFLCDRNDIERAEARGGKDGATYWTLILGVRKTGVDLYRVLTTELCDRHKAFEDIIWTGGARILVTGIDAGYGGDPCKMSTLEFGESVEGLQTVKFWPMVLIPVALSNPNTPEVQISTFVQEYRNRHLIPPENIFVECGMRATLASDMARIVSPQVNAINFGGPATDRPVSADMMIFDPKLDAQRPKTCAEHYSKFITELWYSMRYLVEGGQCRGLPRVAADQFGLREWRFVPGPVGQRIELETKVEYKGRNQHSPNDADAVVTAVEGARRRGLNLARVSDDSQNRERDGWLERELQNHRRDQRKAQLNYKA